MSYFQNVEQHAPDSILGLSLLFAKDLHPNKVHLGIGAYKDEKGNSLVLPSVRKAEEWLLEQKLNKDYLPIEGLPSFLKNSLKLIFGENVIQENIAAIQTIGGSNALRTAGDFFFRQGLKTIYLSNPTWPNHVNLFESAGLKVQYYPYYKTNHSSIQFEEMCQTMESISPSAIILLQASCHNPTGLDLSHDQWKILSEIIKRKKLIPFFDLAYQGFGKNIEEDAWPIRYFLQEKHEIFVASSYSKNMGLYGERVGMLSCVMQNEDTSSRVLSQLKHIIRGNYSTAPLQGVRIIDAILSSNELKALWIEDLEKMRQRLSTMKEQFKKSLETKIPHKNYGFLNEQQGMFFMSGFNPNQINQLIDQYGIYLLNNGRVSLSSLTSDNIEYVAKAFAAVS